MLKRVRINGYTMDGEIKTAAGCLLDGIAIKTIMSEMLKEGLVPHISYAPGAVEEPEEDEEETEAEAEDEDEEEDEGFDLGDFLDATLKASAMRATGGMELPLMVNWSYQGAKFSAIGKGDDAITAQMDFIEALFDRDGAHHVPGVGMGFDGAYEE